MPASLTQHNAALTQRVAGLADLRRPVAVERDLVTGELLLLPVNFTLHKAQLALVIKAGANMFRGLAVNVELNQRQPIALPAVLAG